MTEKSRIIIEHVATGRKFYGGWQEHVDMSDASDSCETTGAMYLTDDAGAIEYLVPREFIKNHCVMTKQTMIVMEEYTWAAVHLKM